MRWTHAIGLDGGGERKHVVLKHGGEHSKEAREVRGVAVDIRLEAAKHGSKTPRQAMESMLREGVDFANMPMHRTLQSQRKKHLEKAWGICRNSWLLILMQCQICCPLSLR